MKPSQFPATVAMRALVCALVTFATAATAFDGTGEAGRFPLAKGTYRLAGQCTKLMFLDMDVTSGCSNSLGIVATDPDRPEFYFLRKDGAWMFKATSSAVVSESGVAIYKIESVMDLGARRVFRYDGECQLTISGASQGAHCTLWKEQDRLTVVREAVFSASGSWVFGRAP
jgi:hypothetical protein